MNFVKVLNFSFYCFAMPLPLFGKSHKSPPDIVKNLKDSLTQLEKLERGDKKNEKVAEEVSKSLQAIKSIIYGQESQEPHLEQVAQLAQESYNSSILPMLIQNLIKLDFEAKKDVAQIFNNLLRRQIGTRSPTVEYVHTRPQILEALVKGYETPEIAVTCGSMLRECIRHENLAKLVLYGNDFYKFFNYVFFMAMIFTNSSIMWRLAFCFYYRVIISSISNY
ncbi:unnamed protein product [Wuchereria bancrofti]|uniref:Uncharacterized protein n=1 Tax=Wuchereria bancrofti TaxID=6293 RepID=A0A3P7DUJ3_WUCBA|nr:unnamed protein product [Wuchereria bancrofti]